MKAMRLQKLEFELVTHSSAVRCATNSTMESGMQLAEDQTRSHVGICDGAGAGAGICDGTPSTCSSLFIYFFFKKKALPTAMICHST